MSRLRVHTKGPGLDLRGVSWCPGGVCPPQGWALRQALVVLVHLWQKAEAPSRGATRFNCVHFRVSVCLGQAIVSEVCLNPLWGDRGGQSWLTLGFSGALFSVTGCISGWTREGEPVLCAPESTWGPARTEMENNVSAGQEQKQRMDMSTWSSTVVAITLGHP